MIHPTNALQTSTLNFSSKKALKSKRLAPFKKDTITFSGKQTVDNISERDGINAENQDVRGSVNSPMGKVRLNNVTVAQDVNGRDGVTLINSSAQNVASPMGKVSIEASQADNEVSGRDGVKMTNSSAKRVTSAMGKVSIEDTKVTGEIHGRDGVSMTNSSAKSVTSSMGTASVIGSNAEGITVDGAVEGRDGVVIDDALAQSAYSGMGKVDLSKALISGNAFGRDGVKLFSSVVDSAISPLGEIEVDCSEVRGTLITSQKNLILKGKGTIVNHIVFKEVNQKGNVSIQQSGNRITVSGSHSRSISVSNGVVKIDGQVVSDNGDTVTLVKEKASLKNLWGVLPRKMVPASGNKQGSSDAMVQTLEVMPNTHVIGNVEFESGMGVVKIHQGADIKESQIKGATIEYV